MTLSNVTRRGVIAGGGGVAAIAASAHTLGAARAQSAQKAFVLVHGTFVGGWYWRRVVDLLEKNGHKVFSPTLTGLGERSHLLSKNINLDTHITDIVNVVKWEDASDVCLAVHSYGGWIGSGALEQISDRVSSIVWLDAYKPENGQKPIELTNEGFRKAVLTSLDKGDAGFAAPKGGPIFPIWVNEKDSAYVLSKLTPQPTGTYLQPINLSGVRDKVPRKTYIRATKFPNPAFDKALAECKADKSWRTIEIGCGHIVMLDEPEWLADTLMNVG
jgi:pimeloyl-ACP methyl ester carboxylesterase